MTATMIIINVLFGVTTLAALAGVCRLGYLVAGGRFDEPVETVRLPVGAHDSSRRPELPAPAGASGDSRRRSCSGR
jgi:hypothetical protein